MPTVGVGQTDVVQVDASECYASDLSCVILPSTTEHYASACPSPNYPSLLLGNVNGPGHPLTLAVSCDARWFCFEDVALAGDLSY